MTLEDVLYTLCPMEAPGTVIHKVWDLISVSLEQFAAAVIDT